MNVSERVAELRKLMKQYGLSAYIIPSADFHNSEYVGEYFKSRAFISGFTGSAGTVVITLDDAGLWTDGRYFIQAEKQLSGSGIRLFKMGEPNVDTINEFLIKTLSENDKLGFDGRTTTMQEGASYEADLKDKNISFSYENDLIDEIWTDRPQLSTKPAFALDIKYAGESFSSKLTRVREAMKKNGANSHIITTLDDIAWLFNFRGDDVLYSPLVLSYAFISMDEVHLFIDQAKLNNEINEELKKENVILHEYNDIYEFIKDSSKYTPTLVDPNKINYAIYKNIPEDVKKIEAQNPIILFKAMKNDVELANIRKSQLKDSIAITKFMRWLKLNVGKETITEIDASNKLNEFRAMQEGYMGDSFAPISAYKDHAAMMHYSATPELAYELKAEHMYLIDSGGNYQEGTTDVTRTFILGSITDIHKKHFSAVVRGMLNLSDAKFLYGSKGYNLDILARQPMWDLDIDYKCGTGHGVGYLLNIHEQPTGFRWQIVPAKNETHTIEKGMLLTNEPGIYIQDSHGIRIENNLIVQEGNKNDFGEFMCFETVTFVPIDLDGIEPTEFNSKELRLLNEYHELVFKELSPYFEGEELEWLKHYTRKI